MIVNNGAVMTVLVLNNEMKDGEWLRPGQEIMIPNNKAVKDFSEAGIAKVKTIIDANGKEIEIGWRKRKIPDTQKVGPTENTALKPALETAKKSETKKRR